MCEDDDVKTVMVRRRREEVGGGGGGGGMETEKQTPHKVTWGTNVHLDKLKNGTTNHWSCIIESNQCLSSK